MKAITRTKYGGPEVLKLEDIPSPKPKEDELLIRVHCTTVNRSDCGILTGKPYAIRFFTGLTKPKALVPGTDFAGEITEVGSSVSEFKVGDRVWGLNDEGLSSQAEFMVINQKKAVVKIPDHFSFHDIIACAEGAHYAYNFLNKIHLTKGDKVLVNGVTGAIGSAAIQFLKDQDIYVTAVGNTKNIDLIKSLGADKIYDYQQEDFTQIDQEKYNFIFDAVGKSSFGKIKHLLKPKGIYISSELGPNSENLYLPLFTKIRGGKRVVFPFPNNCKRTLLYMNDLIERRQFKPVVDQYFKPEQIKEAYEYAQSGQKTGNIILDFA